MRIVMVEWVDSETMDDGWHLKEAFNEFSDDPITPAVSAGLLWRETEHHIVLAQSVSRSCVTGHIKIPKAAIAHMEEVGTASVP